MKRYGSIIGQPGLNNTNKMPSSEYEKNARRARRLTALKMFIRGLLPDWFLRLIRRRQVSLKKMEAFLSEKRPADKANTPRKTLAIVMPCYKHAKFVGKAFESIMAQTHLPDEVIIIDDHSPDETSAVLLELIKKQDDTATRISFVRNENNIGQAMSINKGVALANSDLIMILNDDDYLMHDAVEKMFYLFNKYPDIRLAGGGAIHFGSDEELSRASKLMSDSVSDFVLNISLPHDALLFEDYCNLNITHSGSTFVKESAIIAGLYRPKKQRLVPFSDRDFQIRMNLLFPVGYSYLLPFSFWRYNSSIDSGLNS